MLDFFADPTTMAGFAAFAAGLTQIIKTKFEITDHTKIQLISVAAFVVGAILHGILPDAWKLIFELVAGGIATTGGVGLAKDLIATNRI